MHTIPTRETPPTYHRTNKFTEPFQVRDQRGGDAQLGGAVGSRTSATDNVRAAGTQIIVDAYGVARYQEVNPTPFTVITFPFLFAVMFGDLGHGFIITVIAALFIYYEKRLGRVKLDEVRGVLGSISMTNDPSPLTAPTHAADPVAAQMTAMVFAGRYIILLMGIFSMYTGVIYNDIFSKSMEIFHSGWDFQLINGTNNSFIGEFTGHVYPIGLDPGWHGADNQLIFVNSYKMKMSVIFGVIQVGILLWAHAD